VDFAFVERAVMTEYGVANSTNSSAVAVLASLRPPSLPAIF